MEQMAIDGVPALIKEVHSIRISELIEALWVIADEHGDIEVFTFNEDGFGERLATRLFVVKDAETSVYGSNYISAVEEYPKRLVI